MRVSFVILVLAFIVSVLLTGCSHKAPAKDTLGNAWDPTWTRIGSSLGVDAAHGLTLHENKDILAADGLFYATFTNGSSYPYTNADGEDAAIYDTYLYLLLCEHKSASQAETDTASWLSTAKSSYSVTSEDDFTVNGQAYHILCYDCDPDTSPYARGISAFAVHDTSSVCIELTCLDTFEGDLSATLTGFLESCHYAAP